ncbi:polyprenyl synthetase family protein [Helicobacter bizzozeronii]|uniref:Octaprenyl-diphosphate synthase n=1 Tax=Helicobacter bizzozeronii (strain CIII-1) TaxID=1002804 RepID=F8KRW9_HELBC|nr:polyprenyl synthetase family protein [Helicobacter bizzozeronii]CCB79517.1 octaprenyl-diphosphate synthase [Helicobacter bizzozeronii CIII-1]
MTTAHLYQAFERYLQESKPQLNTFHPFLECAFWEMLENGGKRFRPKLLLATAHAFKPQESFLTSLFPIALALEALHTYSLIHDDLPCMDNANLRRGAPTLHKHYDETSAVLVGDGLNTHAFYLISQAHLASDLKVELIATLAHCGGIYGMVLGQALDCYFEHKHLKLQELETLHTLKTAKLIAASLKMGALCVGALAPPNLPQTLFDLGLELGLFFQVRDDIIDCTQSPQESGKSTHLDTFKNNYVNLLGLVKAQDYLAQLKTQILKKLQNLPLPLTSNLTALLEELA